jgi:hypothetical protein
MNKVSITGGRQIGKAALLVDSIVGHITDPELKDDAALVVCSATPQMNRAIKEAVVAKLQRRKVKFSHRNNKITIGKKSIRFLRAEYSQFIGISIDYIFIDNVGLMPGEFVKFVDMIMRPNVVVIQTYEDSLEIGEYQKDIEIE